MDKHVRFIGAGPSAVDARALRSLPFPYSQPAALRPIDADRETPPRDHARHTILRRAEALARTYPHLCIEITACSVVATPWEAGGFSMSLLYFGDRVSVALGGWYDDFADHDAALWLLGKAFSGRVRIRVRSIGGSPFEWNVESLEPEGRWSEFAGSSNVILFKWRRRIVETILQNPLV